jgi:rubrerythrin
MKINETIAPLAIKEEDKSSDAVLIRQAIIAELDAINLYEQMAKSAKNLEIKKILLDIAKEEKVHVGELEYLLEKTDKEHKSSVRDGKGEVKHFKEWIEQRKN